MPGETITTITQNIAFLTEYEKARADRIPLRDNSNTHNLCTMFLYPNLQTREPSVRKIYNVYVPLSIENLEDEIGPTYDYREVIFTLATGYIRRVSKPSLIGIPRNIIVPTSGNFCVFVLIVADSSSIQPVSQVRATTSPTTDTLEAMEKVISKGIIDAFRIDRLTKRFLNLLSSYLTASIISPDDLQNIILTSRQLMRYGVDVTEILVEDPITAEECLIALLAIFAENYMAKGKDSNLRTELVLLYNKINELQKSTLKNPRLGVKLQEVYNLLL